MLNSTSLCLSNLAFFPETVIRFTLKTTQLPAFDFQSDPSWWQKRHFSVEIRVGVLLNVELLAAVCLRYFAFIFNLPLTQLFTDLS